MAPITGGEALIDPQFAAAYEYATGLGMMIQVSTNGSQLHKVRMQELFARLRPYRLTVSLYGATGETYDAVTRNRGAIAARMAGLLAPAARGGTSVVLPGLALTWGFIGRAGSSGLALSMPERRRRRPGHVEGTSASLGCRGAQGGAGPAGSS